MVNQKDPVEMDRKARVRIAIACNKIVLTAFEQFCVEEQAAERMADRQEILQVRPIHMDDQLNQQDASALRRSLFRLQAVHCYVFTKNSG